MKSPHLTSVLMSAAASLQRDIAPTLALDGFGAGQAGALGVLLILAAQEAGRAADTLVNEQAALRALFAEAALAPLPEDLRDRLAEAGEGGPESFLLDDLEAQSAELSALLIELHALVEESAFDWAERLEARILEILRLGAACRVLYLPTL